MRRKARVIKVGKVFIGGNHPIAVQSMTKCRTADTESCIRQINGLQEAGCDIVRLAIKDLEDARALKRIKAKVKLPLVADIHFSYRLAIAAIENGADKIRLNPGNIHKKQEIEKVISALKTAGIPLRVGLNSGSVKETAHRSSSMTDRLVSSCMDYIKMIEKLKFNNIVISLKANNVLDTVESYRKAAKVCVYPLHLGVTATGSPYNGIIKSSVALGALLMEGIGDTIRVSLTDTPVEEVRAAKCILGSLGLRGTGAQIISCPTCGRCEVDLVGIVKELEERLAGEYLPPAGKPLKIAVMGCVVNGPGEAKEADIGVAFGKKEGLLFKKGKAVSKISFEQCAKVLLEEMKKC
ncbi:flavodoxin-dependent (E)-4-hydroxy-3-methylbut-2-enyl-diphosphate synthase [bacterium]|nr:MAG: flavodoxin-dependent (E)-4-hydroxy-3-methylbut-2-enyl-diphosphate synthase [bacterium]